MNFVVFESFQSLQHTHTKKTHTLNFFYEIEKK